MDIEKYSKEICKTGFVLENRIALELKNAGWTVISNKYYEDDFEGSIREIDLLAYKVSKVQNFGVYTTLLISCKKNESNAWALLARDINLKDPNSDWWPWHAWSNDKAIQYQITQPGKAKTYHDDLPELGVHSALGFPEVEVFAFQEMSSKNGTPQNDKNIFNALTSLMKAQAYELSALPQRKKIPSIYQFNLLSVIDSDLIRLKFSGESIKAEPINAEHYIARYIIKKKETFSRIRFIKASYFKNILAEYDQLHIANCQWFDQECNNFYEGVTKDWRRAKIFIEEFKNKLKWPLYLKIKSTLGKEIDIELLSLDWRFQAKELSVVLPPDADVIKLLNQDDEMKKIVASALKEIYRYTGKFHFTEDDIPF